MSSFLKVLALILISCIGCQAGTGQQDSENEPEFFQRLGVLKSKKITESSGLTRANDPQGAFWTINDSGNGSEVFLIAPTGELLAIVRLEGVVNRDWEAISRFTKDDQSWLVVADVGDNQSRRDTCQLHFFPEPKTADRKPDKLLEVSLRPETIEFRYSDGPRDCETLTIDPHTLDIWVFEKISRLDPKRKSGLYRIKAESWTDIIKSKPAPGAAHPSSSEVPSLKNEAKVVPSVNKSVLDVERAHDFGHLFLTDGDFSPDGKWLIVRNYTNALLFERPEGRTWFESFSSLKPALIPLPLQRQGETIAFTADSNAVVVTSEFARQPIWRVDIPAVLEHLKKTKETTK